MAFNGNEDRSTMQISLNTYGRKNETKDLVDQNRKNRSHNRSIKIIGR